MSKEKSKGKDDAEVKETATLTDVLHKSPSAPLSPRPFPGASDACERYITLCASLSRISLNFIKIYCPGTQQPVFLCSGELM